MYSCSQVIAELAGYLDDEVAAEVRAELEVHLRECRTCRVLYDTSRKTLQIVTDVRSYEIPQPLSERLVGKIMRGLKAEKASKRARRRGPSGSPRRS